MNPVKTALKRDKVSMRTLIQFGHPGIAEVLANAGFDWIAADMKHRDIGIGQNMDLCRGMHGRNSEVLARVKGNDVFAIRQTLDMGWQGVIIPLANNAGGAAIAVSDAKYPPQGIRGYVYHRNINYGVKFYSYEQKANDDVLIVVMVESKEAVENIDEILSVEGVDGIFIGSYDMSGSYRISGQTDHPIMKKAYQTCIAACRKSGKTAGLHVVNVSQNAISKAVSSGFTFISFGMDNLFIDQGVREALSIACRSTDKTDREVE